MLLPGPNTQLGSAWDGGSNSQAASGRSSRSPARRYAGDPRRAHCPLIILFDEPTAALDAPTEYAHFERMAEAARSGEARGALTLVVSHCFSTVRMADLIVVIDKGHIVACSSHVKLMQRRGLNAELYALQEHTYR